MVLLLQFDISTTTRVTGKGFIVTVMVQLSSFLCNPQSVGKPWLWMGNFINEADSTLNHAYHLSCSALVVFLEFLMFWNHVFKNQTHQLRRGVECILEKNTLMIAYVGFWPSTESVERQEAFYFFLEQSQYICLWSLAFVSRHVTHRSQ